MAQEVIETYQGFLSELIKTGCVYQGENGDEGSVTLRVQHLEAMLGTITDESVVNLEANERVRVFMDFVENLVPGGIPTDEGYWDSFCKVMMKKKATKAHKIFFLNSPHECKDINVGQLSLNQPAHNSIQIRNYVYILYCHLCHVLYGGPTEIPDGRTRDIYIGILDVFEEQSVQDPNPSSTAEDTMSVCKTMVDQLFATEEGMDGNKLINMIFDNNNPMVSMLVNGLLQQPTLKGMIDVDTIKNEVSKLSADDLKQIVNDVKGKLEDADLASLVHKFQNIQDPTELLREAQVGEEMMPLLSSLFGGTNDLRKSPNA